MELSHRKAVTFYGKRETPSGGITLRKAVYFFWAIKSGLIRSLPRERGEEVPVLKGKGVTLVTKKKGDSIIAFSG